MTLAKYIAVFRTTFMNSIAYSREFIFSSVFMAVVMFVLISLWRAIYASQPAIDGYSLLAMCWYLLMTETIIIGGPRITQDLSSQVQSGQLAQMLNKPYNFILFNYSSAIAESLIRSAIVFAMGLAIIIPLVGIYMPPLVSIPFVLVSFLLSATLSFLFYFMVGLTAFWFEDSRGFEMIYQKFVFTVGGMLIPLEFFPSWLSGISRYLPFSSIAYSTAKLFVSFSMAFFIQSLLLQLGWIIVAGAAAFYMYHICVQKVVINGG